MTDLGPPEPSLPPPSPPPSPPAYGAPWPPALPPGVGFPPPRQRRLPGWALALILIGAVFGALLLLGVAAAIFVGHKDKSDAQKAVAATTLTLAPTVAGLERLSGKPDQVVQEQVAKMVKYGRPVGAAYGHGSTVHAIVIVAKYPLTPADRKGFLTGVNQSEQRLAGVLQKPVAPGPLGGSFQCATVPGGTRTDCSFVDAGAYGVIDVAGSGATARQLALRIRSEVEHRT